MNIMDTLIVSMWLIALSAAFKLNLVYFRPTPALDKILIVFFIGESIFRMLVA